MRASSAADKQQPYCQWLLDLLDPHLILCQLGLGNRFYCGIHSIKNAATVVLSSNIQFMLVRLEVNRTSGNHNECGSHIARQDKPNGCLPFVHLCGNSKKKYTVAYITLIGIERSTEPLNVLCILTYLLEMF